MLVMSVLGNENTILDGAGRKASISSCKASFMFSFTPNAFPLQKKKKIIIIIIIIGMKYPYFSYTA